MGHRSVSPAKMESHLIEGSIWVTILNFISCKRADSYDLGGISTMSYRHFAGKTSKADRQDLIDRINNTARNEFLHPASGVRKSLFVHRGRHAKPSRIVSPTRSIVALTLAVSSLCVTPAITANATEPTIRDRASSIIEPSRSTSTSGVSPDADASPESKTQTALDTVNPSPHPTQSDGSDVDNGLSPRSGVSEPAGAASPKAELPASGTWGSCQWDIDVNGVLTIHAGTGAQ